MQQRFGQISVFLLVSFFSMAASARTVLVEESCDSVSARDVERSVDLAVGPSVGPGLSVTVQCGPETVDVVVRGDEREQRRSIALRSGTPGATRTISAIIAELIRSMPSAEEPALADQRPRPRFEVSADFVTQTIRGFTHLSIGAGAGFHVNIWERFFARIAVAGLYGRATNREIPFSQTVFFVAPEFGIRKFLGSVEFRLSIGGQIANLTIKPDETPAAVTTDASFIWPSVFANLGARWNLVPWAHLGVNAVVGVSARRLTATDEFSGDLNVKGFWVGAGTTLAFSF